MLYAPRQSNRRSSSQQYDHSNTTCCTVFARNVRSLHLHCSSDRYMNELLVQIVLSAARGAARVELERVRAHGTYRDRRRWITGHVFVAADSCEYIE